MPYKNKQDQAAAAKRHYQSNTDKVKRRAIEQKTESRKRNRLFVWEYLTAHPCIDCGESDPVVLEFDHRDTDTKIMDICTMIQNAGSLVRILTEIEKCDVRCANCHRRKTAVQFNWYTNPSGVEK